MTLKPIGPLPNWLPQERPFMPGSPASLDHPMPRRVAYALVALLVILTGGLGSGLITANIQAIQGHLGLTPVEGSWLVAVYVMVNASANLLLFKFRQRFGILLFAELGLAAYVVLCLLHLMVETYSSALLVRAVAGFATAPLSSLGMYYAMQAFPRRAIGKVLCLTLGLMQISTPLAWVISPVITDIGDLSVIYRLELGMALLSFAAIIVFKLPHGIRVRAFEPLDFLSFALLAPAIAIIGAVFAQMRNQWWEDAPWMAYGLIAAVLMLAAAFLLEHHRSRPLIMTRWLGSADAIRFVMGSVGIRFLLSEQSYTAPGLLRSLGMGVGQLQPLYVIILCGTIAGGVISALMFGPKRIAALIGIAITLILIGSYLEHDATNLTRPQDVYFSQLLIALASGIFMGPLLLTAVASLMSKGTENFITFVVLFSLSQGIGGLAGPAVLGTYQVYREHEYSTLLTAEINPADPQIAQRLALYEGAYAKVIGDPVKRKAQAQQTLAQMTTREANVRAFNDTSLLNTIAALALMLWTFAEDIFRIVTGTAQQIRQHTKRRISVLRYRAHRKSRMATR